MYFPDLANYTYPAGRPLPNIYTIGWLEKGTPFPTGGVSPDFVKKLEQMIRRDRVNVMRGHHNCDYCRWADKDQARELPIRAEDRRGAGKAIAHTLGNFEVWVPEADSKRVFAAPNLVYHYIAGHNYRPPSAFIEAVEAFDLSSDWNGQRIREEAKSLLQRDSGDS